tara:strand:+ start:2598 stop:2798 length:201 start_codon:yes stop_codon:yes gene_type:complete
MARNKNTGRKRTEKRLKELRRQLATGWPPSNPKAATARWELVREYAYLTDQKVQVVKKMLSAGLLV